jgi:hypothetical protein
MQAGASGPPGRRHSGSPAVAHGRPGDQRHQLQRTADRRLQQPSRQGCYRRRGQRRAPRRGELRSQRQARPGHQPSRRGDHKGQEQVGGAADHHALAPGRQRQPQVDREQADRDRGEPADLNHVLLPGGNAERSSQDAASQARNVARASGTDRSGRCVTTGVRWCSAPRTPVDNAASTPRWTAATTGSAAGSATPGPLAQARATPQPTSPAGAAARKPSGTLAGGTTAAMARGRGTVVPAARTAATCSVPSVPMALPAGRDTTSAHALPRRAVRGICARLCLLKTMYVRITGLAAPARPLEQALLDERPAAPSPSPSAPPARGPLAGKAMAVTTSHSQLLSHRYTSGWCEAARHDRCKGSYAGTACSCSCHREPVPRERAAEENRGPAPAPWK